MRLSELATAIDAELTGADASVHACATLEDAREGDVSFLANPRYAPRLQQTRASAVIVAPTVQSTGVALLRATDPYYAFARAVIALHGFRQHPHTGIHPLACVHASAVVGEGTVIYPFAFIGPRVRIGRDCIVYPNATVYDDTLIGDRVTIHAGASIGQDGFGYATHGGEHHKIPQAGHVVIEDDVEIGSNCCIDRSTLGSTVIGRGTKMSNLVAIGHGVKTGEHGLLVAQAGIAGSTTLGHHVTLGGQVGIAGHLRIGDNVSVAAQSGITNHVASGQAVLGTPAMPIGHARRTWVVYRQLPQLLDRLAELEARVARLDAAQSSTEPASPSSSSASQSSSSSSPKSSLSSPK